jgi:hypothetical protein
MVCRLTVRIARKREHVKTILHNINAKAFVSFSQESSTLALQEIACFIVFKTWLIKDVQNLFTEISLGFEPWGLTILI